MLVVNNVVSFLTSSSIYSNICSKCYNGCVKCQDAFLEDWNQWDFPTPFLLDTTCVNSCPTDLYNYDYSNYEWVKNSFYDSVAVGSNFNWQTSSLYTKDNLSVKVVLSGVSSSLMSSAGGVLSMDITNNRGNINYFKFVQIEPTPDPNSALTNVFPLISGTTNQYVNETKVVELNAATINNYAVGTIFKVMAEVHNDWGDISRGYISFALSMTPTIGNAIISCYSTPWKFKETMTITLTGNWYNTEVLLMELYIRIEFKLSDGTIVLVYPEKWQQKTFVFTVPVLSTTSGSMIVDCLITATNIYDKSSTLTKSITFDNTLTSGYRSTLYSVGTDYTSLLNIVLLGTQMKLTLSIPSNIIQNQDLCQQNSDCSNNGECIKERNGNYCNWDEGYSGIDCSMDSHEYSMLKVAVSSSLKYLLQYLTANSLNGRRSVEDQVTALANLLIRPEFVDFTYVSQIAQAIQSISLLPDSTLLALPDTFISSFINTVSSYFIRIKYEYNVNMKKQNATEYYASIDQQSYSTKLAKMQNDSKNVWISLEKYMTRISIKATSLNTVLSYETITGLFKVEYRIANTINGTTYSINNSKNYNIVFPSNLFDSTSISNMTSVVRILAVTWYINPIPLSELDIYKYGSNTLSIYLLDYNRDIIAVSDKSLYLSIQYDKSYSYSSSTEAWSSWNVNLSTNTLSSSSWSVSFTGTSTQIFSEWSYCTTHSIAVIISTHLSSFWITVPTNSSIQTTTINGVGPRHKPLEDIPEIQDSVGFFFMCSLFVLFAIGLWIIIPVEMIKSRKK